MPVLYVSSSDFDKYSVCETTSRGLDTPGSTSYDWASGATVGHIREPDRDEKYLTVFYGFNAGAHPELQGAKITGVDIEYDVSSYDDGYSNSDIVISFRRGFDTAGISDRDIYRRGSTMPRVSQKTVTISAHSLNQGAKGAVTVDASEAAGILQDGVTFTAADGSKYKDYNRAAVRFDLRVTYSNQAFPPEISITSPANGAYLPIVDGLPLGWSYKQLSNSEQASVEIEIGKSSSAYSPAVVLTQPAKTANISPDKLPPMDSVEQRIYYRIRAKSAAGVYSNYAESNVNFVFPACRSLSPANGEVILAENPAKFAWKAHTVRSNGQEIPAKSKTLPTNFTLQYSYNGGETWRDLFRNSAVSRDAGGLYSTPMTEPALAGNIVTWRVAPVINGSKVDNFAEEYYKIKITPGTSAVTCDGKPRPLLSWKSASQVAFQVRFAGYDSGVIYSAEKSYTVPYFYADGNYPVQVRTQASSGEWSAWSEVEYAVIKNTPPPNIVTMQAAPSRHAVTVEWTDSATAAAYILYRDGVPIYVGPEKRYTDPAANGECEYFVRATVDGKNYAQSETQKVRAYPAVDCIYDVDGHRWVPLRLSPAPRTRVYRSSQAVAYSHYAGRPQPIAFTAGARSRQLDGQYTFHNRDEALRIAELNGARVIFKDTRGGIIIGILNDAEIIVGPRLYDVKFTVTEIDTREAVPYNG